MVTLIFCFIVLKKTKSTHQSKIIKLSSLDMHGKGFTHLPWEQQY